jgi:hypothetical protein
MRQSIRKEVYKVVMLGLQLILILQVAGRRHVLLSMSLLEQKSRSYQRMRLS